MKYVNLNFILNDLKNEILFKFILNNDNSITVINLKKNNNISLDSLLNEKEFIIGEKGQRFSILKDGENFLKNLKFAFSGSRLRASDIIEE